MYNKHYLRFTSLTLILAFALLLTGTADAEGQSRVVLCHKPGSNEVTIEVAEASVDAHLAHGDRSGQCEEVFLACPFEPMSFELTNPDPLKVPVQIATSGQDLNFGATDPPGVFWALTELDDTILVADGLDDHFHLTWGGPYYFSDPGYYYMVFSHPAAGTTYPTIQINLACDYEAPEP